MTRRAARCGDDSTMRVTGYGGTRGVRQYLALPGTGADVVGRRRRPRPRLRRRRVRGSPGSLGCDATGDADARRRLRARSASARQGYVNNNGQLGALRRDEDDTGDQHRRLRAGSSGMLAAALTLTGRRPPQRGALPRPTTITSRPANPDDSGSRSYSHASPVLGVVWHVADAQRLRQLRARASRRRRSPSSPTGPVGTGPQPRARAGDQPAVEVGLKAIVGERASRQRSPRSHRHRRRDRRQRVDRRAHDLQECRAHPAPRRRGRVGWRAGARASARMSRDTYLRREFAVGIATGQPPRSCRPAPSCRGSPDGRRTARSRGVPPALRVRGRRRGPVRRQGVRQRPQQDAAPAYTIGNVRVGSTQRSALARCAPSSGSTTSPTSTTSAR